MRVWNFPNKTVLVKGTVLFICVIREPIAFWYISKVALYINTRFCLDYSILYA